MVSGKILVLATSLLLVPLVSKPCATVCRVDSTGYTVTKHFEGFSPFIYRDSGGKSTVGFGHLVLPGEQIKQPLIGADAQKLLEQDMAGKEEAVRRLIKVKLHQEQFDSLADFAFNVGEGNLARSTLLKHINSGQHGKATAEFFKWHYVNGKEVEGLYLRRQIEAAFYALK